MRKLDNGRLTDAPDRRSCRQDRYVSQPTQTD